MTSLHVLYKQICLPSQNVLRIYALFQISRFASLVQKRLAGASLTLSLPAVSLPASQSKPGWPSHSQLANKPYRACNSASRPEADERSSNQVLVSLTDQERKERKGLGPCQSESNSGMAEREPQVSGLFFPPTHATPLISTLALFSLPQNSPNPTWAKTVHAVMNARAR